MNSSAATFLPIRGMFRVESSWILSLSLRSAQPQRAIDQLSRESLIISAASFCTL
jgi:hypothetical protein